MARYCIVLVCCMCLGQGPPPRPPPFEGLPPSGTSAVFDYGHGEPAGDAFGRHSQEPEDFYPDRDEDMRFRGRERDRDLRHERDLIASEYDRDRRPPFPDVHERGGWPEHRERGPEHRERDFPGNRLVSYLDLSGNECCA